MTASTCSRNSRIVKGHNDHMDFINRKVDERAVNGKSNEDYVSNHYVGNADDGSRVWSF